MKKYSVCILFWLLCLASCSSGAGNIPCDKQADNLDKEYDAIVKERSPDPKRVFKQFNDLKEKADKIKCRSNYQNKGIGSGGRP